MTDALDFTEAASLAILGVALASLLAVLAWLRRSARRESPASVWVLPLCLASLVVSLLAGVSDLETYDAATLLTADAVSWPTFVARGMATVYARLGLGQAASACVLLAVSLGLLVTSRRSAVGSRLTVRWLAASAASLALVAGVIARALQLRAAAYDSLPGLERASWSEVLVAAADALEPLVLARVVLTLLAFALVAAYLRIAAAHGVAPLRGIVAVACVVGVQLGALALEHAAAQQALATLATPWSQGSVHDMIAATELGDDDPFFYGAGRARLVLGRDGLVDVDTGQRIEDRGPALVEGLRTHLLRLRAERELAERAYAAEEAAEDVVYDTDSERDGERIMALTYVIETLEGCEPPDGDELLAVAVDRHVSAEVLQRLVGAASEAGFTELELLGPMAPPATWAALAERDPTGAAIAGHAAYSVAFSLPPSCAVRDQMFLRATLGAELPTELEHSTGTAFPLVERGWLARYREITGVTPEVVLALGPDVTPLVLVGVHPRIWAAVEHFHRPRLVAAPEALPQAPPMSPLAPLPPDNGVDAGRLVVRAPMVHGSLDEGRLRSWVREELRAPLEGCARAEHAQRPEPVLGLRVRFVVAGGGAVPLALAQEQARPRSPFAACVEDVFESSRYPGEVTSDFEIVTQQLAFERPEPPPPAR